ncbi:SPOR domain-containing protein [uncultured Bradyrhizobium sp.]|uniref:SPOR domain-containing protein n=1 Tax=uncultured Bradyrhizobium sp. TaxID=199684 RepID=UPI0035C99354
MADRYQDKPFPADDDDRGSQHAPAKGDSDPLAELARLIGQTDPFASFGRANQPMPPREPAPYYPPEQGPEIEEPPAAGPPSWMQRAAQQEAASQQDLDLSVHPLRRYAAAHPPAEPEYHEAPPFAADTEQHPQADPARYDDALYGQPDPGAHEEHDPAYTPDPYAYQDGYGEEAMENPKPRRGGMITVAAVLALAVVGTGGAFAYRTYIGSPRSGEPPIIRADAGPTKIVPAPSGDAAAKVPDRMTSSGAEKIVPREEAPVDVNAQAGTRVVFPPLNTNANPPPAASVAPGAKPVSAAANGTMGGDEPRKIRTLAVKGDPADVAATPAPKPATAPRPVPAPAAARVPTPAANANASANAPLSLSPQAAPAGGTSYVVQVSSQRSEADAQASYRALQGKFPSVLGSRTPLIKRADLGDKGVYYRAMLGPFGSSEEAAQVCGSLKTAGGQCVVQKN